MAGRAESGARARAKKGDPIIPCGDCETPLGHTRKSGTRPVRVDGARFGFAIPLCLICYTKHNQRERTRLKKARAKAERIAAAAQAPTAPPVEVSAPSSTPYRERLRADARHLSLVIQGRVAS